MLYFDVLGSIHILCNHFKQRGLSQMLMFDNMGGGSLSINVVYYFAKKYWALLAIYILNINKWDCPQYQLREAFTEKNYQTWGKFQPFFPLAQFHLGTLSCYFFAYLGFTDHKKILR